MSRVGRLLKPVGLSGLVESRAYKAVRTPIWSFSNTAQRSRRALLALKNSQVGAEGFVIGTGPSLNAVDFSKLRGQPTIGLNRLFLGFDRFDFVPDILVCVNLMMVEQSAPRLSALPCQLITSWSTRQSFTDDTSTVFARTTSATDFSHNLTSDVSTGGTVTYVALQLAYWMGWSKVTLIGIDHQYKLEKHENDLKPHAASQRQSSDNNHFVDSYFPAGSRWQLPDLSQSELAYRNARLAFEADGRQIVNGTVGGNLTVFERSDVCYAHGPDRPSGLIQPDCDA